MPIALFSVSNKRGLVEFATTLSQLGWDFVASDGTAKALRDGGLTVTNIADLTESPEMLGGRVKTLHPKIYGGILARATQEDQAELDTYQIKKIDMVVCNLYPFQDTVASADVDMNDAVERIDVGGVTLLRAAAKNFARVTVICDPNDYSQVARDLRESGGLSKNQRTQFARKAFNHTAEYDVAISNYLSKDARAETASIEAVTLDTPDEELPVMLMSSLVKIQEMRYGENPHQSAALYSNQTIVGPLNGILLQGKPLSYNNMLDLDAAWRAAQGFDDPSVVIVKHLSPCGIATANSLTTAFPEALASDPVSAFGGVVAVNRTFGNSTAEALGKLFIEAIAAPAFSEGAKQILAKRKNCRLLEIDLTEPAPLEFRSIAGGVLVQASDYGDPPETEWKVVTERQPTEEEMTSLKFAWKACQHIKSNAIVFAAGTATVGIGGGLPSRVDAVKLAASKAGEKAKGAVLASDAFFPFADGIEAAAQAGVTAVIEPGGSIRDQEVIDAANRLNLALVFTGVRHFRH
ncbi:bifunctional phosphoribosylaminoimidazolecarboxamide formyltransferase/IMP cyclohydrolase [Anaerolineales bacterium HSG24]|nr:bifunctional phosphoribosylaminoimidazolecarboxamide formyltransferase/IMP cyclohydrolase [Anaerolineales bacterium HSG24]